MLATSPGGPLVKDTSNGGISIIAQEERKWQVLQSSFVLQGHRLDRIREKEKA